MYCIFLFSATTKGNERGLYHTAFQALIRNVKILGESHLTLFMGPFTKVKTKDKKSHCLQQRPHK